MKRRAPRNGFLLVIVLIVIMVLALGACAFCELMISHREATDLSGKQIQCRVMTDSGVEAVRLFLAQDPATRDEAGGTYDNPDQFRGVLVVDSEEAKSRGRFSLVSPSVDDEGNLGGVRFGLENESTRLNLNSLLIVDKQSPGAARALLMALPTCTEEIADAILDWIDPDDEPREYGAEVDYYSGIVPAYAPKNGSLDTVEELLLVRGITPQLLFGMDVNRNGVVDPFEQTGAPTTVTTTIEQPTAGALTGQLGSSGDSGITIEADLSRGWSAYLTLYSMERNANSKGEPRVYLNQTDMNQLSTQLKAVMPEDWVAFIIAYKQFGPYSGTDLGQRGAAGPLDLTRQGSTQIAQVLDLIDAKTSVTFQGASSATVLQSPFSSDLGAMGLYLPTLLDNCTVSQAPIIPGRINLNQASKTVLAGVPGMTEDILSEIISRRQFEAPEEMPNRRFETWIMAEAIVTPAQMKLLMPFLCGGGDVYRAQVVGYYEGGGASARSEVIWDATEPDPRVLCWRDLSHLGRGFALETLGIELSELP
jgi:DNA uptake protein ComE-like DNA-binding protein